MLNRRTFLAGVGSAAGLLILNPFEPRLLTRLRFAADPFTLGVASGDPTPSGIVLWTRLAPDPLHGGGMEPVSAEVRWMLAADDGFKRIVQQGTAIAPVELGHSVHVEVEGLEPGRHYWYRFETGGIQSPVGRTRTAPAVGSHFDRMRFAFASCQNWPTGHYAAYRHMAEQDLDLVLHLGDYIYEGRLSSKNARGQGIPNELRPEPMTLAQYRLRYALYKMDPHLKAAHAAFPFVVTWDDHEVENNYAAELDQNGSEPATFLARRAAAYQAYYEHMPLRRAQLPKGAKLRLHRRLTYGDLAGFSLLDTRQYRSDQVPIARAAEPDRVMLGKEQEKWLVSGLANSGARWNIVPQQVWMARVTNPNGALSGDNWNGYTAERDRILSSLHQAKVANTVVLTGDSHKNMVSDLKLDFDRPESPTVAVEFAGTAISSGGIDPGQAPAWDKAISEQPHVKWFEGVKRGYVTCTADAEKLSAEFWAVDNVRDAKSKVERSALFVVESGKPGVRRSDS